MIYALSFLILFFYSVPYPENCCARDIELGKRSKIYVYTRLSGLGMHKRVFRCVQKHAQEGTA